MLLQFRASSAHNISNTQHTKTNTKRDRQPHSRDNFILFRQWNWLNQCPSTFWQKYKTPFTYVCLVTVRFYGGREIFGTGAFALSPCACLCSQEASHCRVFSHSLYCSPWKTMWGNSSCVLATGKTDY